MALSMSYSAIASIITRARQYKQRRHGSATGKAATNEQDDDLRSTGSTACCETPTNGATFGRTSSGTSTLCSPTFSNQATLSPSSSTASHSLRLQGWMYWARYEPVAADRQSRYQSAVECEYEYESPKKHQTVMKVYAVLRNEFLLLYRDDHKSSRHNNAPLIQIAVDRSGRSINGALHVFDPHGEELELHLYDRHDEGATRQWEVALEQAAELTHSYFAKFDVKVEELPRGSMYRGTLRDFRRFSQQRPSFRLSAREKLKSIASLRPSRVFGGRPSVALR
ncbi:hypothetical protein Gpo141_00001671 [Globisporangium polare]